MRKILLGTTNPSKAQRFRELLAGFPVKFLTLRDLNITQVPEETGHTPEENARIKAEFYYKFCSSAECEDVICNDTGLYFNELSLNEECQPGLHIRSPKGESLGDDAMIEYYKNLVHQLGGKVMAYNLDALAVNHKGKIVTFSKTEEEAKKVAFYMVDQPSPLRHEGRPLDSISIDLYSGKYFVEPEEQDATEKQDKSEEHDGYDKQGDQVKQVELVEQVKYVEHNKDKEQDKTEEHVKYDEQDLEDDNELQPSLTVDLSVKQYYQRMTQYLIEALQLNTGSVDMI